MRSAKTYFEQIPVKIVKTMVEDPTTRKKILAEDIPTKACRKSILTSIAQKEDLNDEPNETKMNTSSPRRNY